VSDCISEHGLTQHLVLLEVLEGLLSYFSGELKLLLAVHVDLHCHLFGWKLEYPEVGEVHRVLLFCFRLGQLGQTGNVLEYLPPGFHSIYVRIRSFSWTKRLSYRDEHLVCISLQNNVRFNVPRLARVKRNPFNCFEWNSFGFIPLFEYSDGSQFFIHGHNSSIFPFYFVE